MPPAQHAWQRGEENPELLRLWSWMCNKTIHWQHRNEYAINELGEELHLEHAARDLGMDPANVYRAWRDGAARGLWRNGSKEEGGRRRLYLCGDVRPSEKGEDKEKIVCADNFPSNLPPYIKRQIAKLDPAAQKEFLDGETFDTKLRDLLRADFDAAQRLFIAQRQDTRFQKFGIKKIREKHHPRNAPAEVQARRDERIQMLLPVLEPLAERYVALPEMSAHTIKTSAQSSNIDVRTQSAQAVSDKRSLLSRDPSEGVPESRARGLSSAPRRPAASLPNDGKKSDGYLPTQQALPKLTGEDEDAENLLWNEVRNMQEAYPHTGFSSELLNRETRRDQFFIRGLLNTVGAANVYQFVLWVAGKFKGIDRNGLAKLEPRAPGYKHGPRSLGLLATWASEYKEKLDEAARETVGPRRRKDEIRAALNVIADPHATPDAKLYASQLIRGHGENPPADAVLHAVQLPSEECRLILADPNQPPALKRLAAELLRERGDQRTMEVEAAMAARQISPAGPSGEVDQQGTPKPGVSGGDADRGGSHESGARKDGARGAIPAY